MIKHLLNAENFLWIFPVKSIEFETFSRYYIPTTIDKIYSIHNVKCIKVCENCWNNRSIVIIIIQTHFKSSQCLLVTVKYMCIVSIHSYTHALTHISTHNNHFSELNSLSYTQTYKIEKKVEKFFVKLSSPFFYFLLPFFYWVCLRLFCCMCWFG